MSGSPIIDGAFLASLETLALYVKTAMSGRLGGMHRSRASGSSTEFLDYREYVPGDDLRRIDWNLVARLDKHYVKQFVAERQYKTHIYLDLSASISADENKARMALRLAAACGFLSVQGLDRAGYRLLTGAQCRDLCGTLCGRESFYRAARLLESLSFSGETDLGAALMADPDPGFDDGLSVIISDFFTDSDWRSAVDRLLSRRREVVLIALTSPEETEPQYAGPLSLTDMETPGAHAGLRLNVDRDALWAYRQAVAAFRQELSAFCASRGIALVEARSDEPIERIILQKGWVA
ncbi:MAG: DUF58 domain-containing protein [Clostridia bacterium]|nr:DUF58 domain-containing protein [Clostridia bacterium]